MEAIGGHKRPKVGLQKKIQKTEKSCFVQQTLNIFIQHWGKIPLLTVFLEIIRRYSPKIAYLEQVLKEWWSIKKSFKNIFSTSFENQFLTLCDLQWPPVNYVAKLTYLLWLFMFFWVYSLFFLGSVVNFLPHVTSRNI